MFSRQHTYPIARASNRRPRPWERQIWRRSQRVFLLSWDWELWRLSRLLASLLHPLRNASLLVALVFTAVEAGQPEAWTLFLGELLFNLVALLVVTWLIGEVGVALAVAIDEWRRVLLGQRQHSRKPPRRYYQRPSPLTPWH